MLQDTAASNADPDKVAMDAIEKATESVVDQVVSKVPPPHSFPPLVVTLWFVEQLQQLRDRGNIQGADHGEHALDASFTMSNTHRSVS